MTFLTSYRTRSIGRVGDRLLVDRSDSRFGLASIVWVVAAVVHRPSASPPALLVNQYLGQAGGAAGDVDRNGQADPDEDVLVRRVDQGRDDPDDLSVAVEERAARVARVDRRVDLDQPLQERSAVRFLEGPIQAGNDAGLIDPVRPNGLPTT